jgi:hypothetical protein
MPTGNGKGAVARARDVATELRFEDGRMVVVLEDRREMSLPLSLYPTLRKATAAQREAWELIGPGKGFHWEGLDLDLSVEGLLRGLREAVPAPPRARRGGGGKARRERASKGKR